MPLAGTLATAASAVLAAAAGTAAWAGMSSGSQIFGPSLVAPPLPNQIALTFDDGPNPAYTPRLLDVLRKHEVRATFFLIGEYVLREPALVQEIAAHGHRIGNHTMHHPFLPRHSNRFIREQLAGCSAALEATLGSPVTLFRAPHGARRPAVMQIAHDLGLTTVQWNLIVGDWMRRPADDLLRRLERGILHNQRHRQGTMIVLHDGSQTTPAADRGATVDAVERLLARVPAGTSFVTPPDWQ